MALRRRRAIRAGFIVWRDGGRRAWPARRRDGTAVAVMTRLRTWRSSWGPAHSYLTRARRGTSRLQSPEVPRYLVPGGLARGISAAAECWLLARRGRTLCQQATRYGLHGVYFVPMYSYEDRGSNALECCPCQNVPRMRAPRRRLPGLRLSRSRREAPALASTLIEPARVLPPCALQAAVGQGQRQRRRPTRRHGDQPLQAVPRGRQSAARRRGDVQAW